MASTRWLVVATLGLLAVAPCTASASVGFQRADLPAGGSPLSVAIGDLDGAHGPDIVVALYDVGMLSVRLNRGDGTFADPVLVPAACGPVQVELSDVTTNGSDFARDGRLDAVVACLGTGKIVRMAGDGSGGFAAPTQPGPPSNGAALISSDFFVLARMRENDGPPLLLVRTPAPNNQHVLCASYDWAALDPCLTQPSFPAIGGPLIAADANGGGLDEVVTLGGGKGVAIFGIADVPNRIFAWSDRDFGTTASGALALAVGDLEPDGHPDVVTGWGNSIGAAISVLHGYATGLPDLPAESFASVAGLNELAIGDFDGDGRNDVLAATGFGRAVVHSGDGAGNIGPPQDVPLFGYQNPATGTVVRLAVADLDGNGSRDAVVVDQSNRLVEVLRNTVAASVPPAGGGSNPVVTPGPAPKPKPAPLSGLTGLPVVATADAAFVLRLGKATNPPTASASLTLKARHGKAVTLARTTVTIQPGKTRALRVKLNKKGRARLHRSRRIKVSLKIVATAPNGTTARRTRSLTIKRATFIPSGRCRRRQGQRASWLPTPGATHMRRLRDRGGPEGTRYTLREKMFSIGDDFWIETADGERAFKVNGKALRIRQTLVVESRSGEELFTIQEKKLSVRDKMEVERDGKTVATHQEGARRDPRPLLDRGRRRRRPVRQGERRRPRVRDRARRRQGRRSLQALVPRPRRLRDRGRARPGRCAHPGRGGVHRSDGSR